MARVGSVLTLPAARQGLVGGVQGAKYSQPAPMEEGEFDRVAKALIQDAKDHADKNWKQPRLDGWEDYHGRVQIEPQEGDDTTIAYIVRDAVQQVLPEIMEQLAGFDEPIEYYTHDPAKHELCRQATTMAISTFWENGGWLSIFDSTTHAAVGRLGFLKTYRKEELKFEDHEIHGYTPDMIQSLMQQPAYVLMEWEDFTEMGYGPDGQQLDYNKIINGTVRRYYIEDKTVVDAPDPATMFATQSVSLDTALCVGQETTVRMGNLRAAGFEPEELMEIDGFEDHRQQNEQSVRNRENVEAPKGYGTWALKPVTMYEAYCMIDADGDGLPERWKVIAAGTDMKVLRRTRVRDQPYSAVAIRRTPHNIAGFSFADLLRDLQTLITKMTRGLSENVDLQNNPMLFGSGTVNFTQLQNIKKRKVVNEGTPGAVRWFAPPGIAGEVLPVLDYFRSVRSERVGVDPAAQGLAPDQLTGTAAVAIAGAQAATQRVIKMMVRTIAETGMRDAFQKLLRLLVGEPPQHVYSQEGKYVVVNPRAFDPMWGVRTRVGLGALAEQERQGFYTTLLGLVQSLVSLFGPQNPFIDAPKLAALIQASAGELRGIGAQRFFNTPDEAKAFMDQQAQNPPPPDPKMIEVQGKLSQAQQKMQADTQTKQAQIQLDNQRGMVDLQTKANLGAQKNLLEHDARMTELALQVPLEKYAIDKKNQAGQGNIPRRPGSRR
jgi:hypothetical protein